MAPPTDFKEPRRSNRRSAQSSTSASKSSGSPPPDDPPVIVKDTDNHSASSTSNTTTARTKKAKEEHDDHIPANRPSHRRTTSVSSMNPPNGNPASASGAAVTSKRAKRKPKDSAPPPEEIIDATAQEADDTPQDAATEGPEDEEDAGVTRCVCEGLADDDADAADFMIQCETCKVWQHGPCMGFASEYDIPQGDYYCEQCKPEDHVELLKKMHRRQRQGSEKSHHTAHHSRTSRSHSPTQHLKPPKRRNTMNSRDAAYEESLKAILDATAADAETATGEGNDKDPAGSAMVLDEATDEYIEMVPGSRKKRKRGEEEQTPMKRKRSASTASERPIMASGAVGDILVDLPVAGPSDLASLLPPPAPTGKSRVRRGGGRKTVAMPDPSINGDTDEGGPKKHPNQYTYRGKPATQSQPRSRPPASSSLSINGNAQVPTPSQSSQTTSHDHGTRRNASNAHASNSPYLGSVNAGGGQPSGSSRGTHHYQQHYSNTQMPMFASWGLPDYLAHLQSILPNDVPPPLNIRGAMSFFREDVLPPNMASAAGSVGGDEVTDDPGDGTTGAAESRSTNHDHLQTQMAQMMAGATGPLTERGVKAKWPAKRMSVADMNKRVRALVEWVGREQALALDRERRRIALDTALANSLKSRLRVEEPAVVATGSARMGSTSNAPGNDSDDPNHMVVDGAPLTESPTRELDTTTQDGIMSAAEPAPSTSTKEPTNGSSSPMSPVEPRQSSVFNSSEVNLARISTTTMMEELMAELINFQERFGPGAKGQNKERMGSRTAIFA